jgi:DNA invertase Pin-like site-specific DNA recombinase
MGRSPEPDSAAGDKLRRALAGSRDDAVREAAAAGLSFARIQKITGLAVTTIMRILNSHPAAGVPLKDRLRTGGAGGR